MAISPDNSASVLDSDSSPLRLISGRKGVSDINLL